MITNVFKPTIFLTENTVDSNMLVSLLPVERSYYTEALDFIRSSQRDMYKEKKKYYKYVLESNGDLRAINEGFELLKDGFKKIIDAIIKFVKAIYNKFITAINSVIKSEKYLKNHKEDFTKFNDEKHKFTFKGYQYTFKDDIPQIKAVTFLDDITGAIFELDAIRINTAKEEDTAENNADNKALGGYIETQITDLKDKLDNGIFYDRFRGHVLNSQAPISDSDYSEALTETYRNGETVKTDIDVTNIYVNEAIKRFSSNEKDSNTCKTSKNRIDKEYKQIKDDLDKIVKRDYSSGSLKVTLTGNNRAVGDLSAFEFTSEEIANKVNRFIKIKQDQIQEMGNIHTAAFAAKLDAYKQCLVQDKQVLYKALSKIHGTIREYVGPESDIDYVSESKTFDFRNGSYADKQDLSRYINECVILSDYSPRGNRMAKLAHLNEGAADNIKAGLNKVHQFIQKIWAKFVERLDSLVAKDRTYLEKYKDIILKKKPVDASYEMKNYPAGIINITNTSVPIFNYNGLKDKLASEVDFTKFLVSGKKPEYDPEKQDFVDYCKALFTGGEETSDVNSSQINMTNLWNYCYEYKDLKEKIKKDSNTIEAAVSEAERVINAIPTGPDKPSTTAAKPDNTEDKPEAPKAETPAAPTTTSDADKEKVKGESFRFNGNPKAYSVVYEAVITEELKRTVHGDKPSNDSGSSNSSVPSTQSAAKQTSNTNTSAGDRQETDAIKASVAADGDSEKELDEAKDKIMIYMTYTKDLFAAKLTASEEIYKSYMQIIRIHVRDHVGTNNKISDKTVQTATNYSNLSEEEKKLVTKYIGSEEELKNMTEEDARLKVQNAPVSDVAQSSLSGAIGNLYKGIAKAVSGSKTAEK